jgi:hypothetical protein
MAIVHQYGHSVSFFDPKLQQGMGHSVCSFLKLFKGISDVLKYYRCIVWKSYGISSTQVSQNHFVMVMHFLPLLLYQQLNLAALYAKPQA